MIDLLQSLADLGFRDGGILHIGKLLEGEGVVFDAVFGCGAKLQGELFKISGFDQRVNGIYVNARSGDGFGEVCHIEILLAVDFVVFFTEHFGVDDVECFFFRADVGEEIMNAFRITEIKDLVAATDGELGESKMKCERGCGITSKIGACCGKLKSGLFGGIDESRNEKSTAEKVVVAPGATENVPQIFAVAVYDIVNDFEIFFRKGVFINGADLFRLHRDACDLCEESGVGFGNLERFRLENAGVLVCKRGKTEHAGKHRMTATILAGGFFGKLDFCFAGK